MEFMNLKSNESSEIYPVYCHMSSLSTKCGGGGWTLVMKLDRDKVKYGMFSLCKFQIPRDGSPDILGGGGGGERTHRNRCK